jgi:prevent-host-death family protein
MSMVQVSIYDARNRLSALIEEVERGNEVVITRHGKVVAKLIRAGQSDRAAQAVANLRELREEIARQGAPFSAEEIQSLRTGGRR